MSVRIATLSLGFCLLFACRDGGELGSSSEQADASSTGERDGDGGTTSSVVCAPPGPRAPGASPCTEQKCFVAGAGSATPTPCSGLHDHTWDLVVRTARGNELWRDATAHLLWGDDSQVGANQATAANFCRDSSTGTDTNGDLVLPFRLPTRDEYASAERHGIRRVLRSIEGVIFWSSSPYGDGEAWYFEDGQLEHMSAALSDEYFRAHCVAHSE